MPFPPLLLCLSKRHKVLLPHLHNRHHCFFIYLMIPQDLIDYVPDTPTVRLVIVHLVQLVPFACQLVVIRKRMGAQMIRVC